MKKIIRRWLCEHKKIRPVYKWETIFYSEFGSHSDGSDKWEAKKEKVTHIIFVYNCEDCGKKIKYVFNF